MLKEIHTHLGAGGDWEAKTTPPLVPPFQKLNNPETRGFLVIPNLSEGCFVFNHNVYVLKTPPWCLHFLFTAMGSKEQMPEGTGDSPCTGQHECSLHGTPSTSESGLEAVDAFTWSSQQRCDGVPWHSPGDAAAHGLDGCTFPRRESG